MGTQYQTFDSITYSYFDPVVVSSEPIQIKFDVYGFPDLRTVFPTRPIHYSQAVRYSATNPNSFGAPVAHLEQYFNFNNLPDTLYQSGNGTPQFGNFRITFEYDSFGNITSRKREHPAGTSWILASQDLYTFNSNGDILTQDIFGENLSYIYDSNNLLSSIYETTYLFTVNEFFYTNGLKDSITYFNSPSNPIPYKYTKHYYTGTRIDSIHQRNFNAATNQYNLPQRTIFSYDTNDNLINQSNSVGGGGVYIAYNNDGNITSIQDFRYFNEHQIARYYYGPETISLSDEEIPTILIYPNPVIDQLFVQGLSGNEFYVIYSICGEIIQSGLIQNNKIDVHTLESGFYILKMKNHGGTKFVKR